MFYSLLRDWASSSVIWPPPRTLLIPSDGWKWTKTNNKLSAFFKKMERTFQGEEMQPGENERRKMMSDQEEEFQTRKADRRWRCEGFSLACFSPSFFLTVFFFWKKSFFFRSELLSYVFISFKYIYQHFRNFRLIFVYSILFATFSIYINLF